MSAEYRFIAGEPSEPAHYSGWSAVLLYIIRQNIFDSMDVRSVACAVCCALLYIRPVHSGMFVLRHVDLMSAWKIN